MKISASTPPTADARPTESSPKAAATTEKTAGNRHGPAVEVRLSEPAKTHGNAANSPAHRARALLAEHPELAGQPFGKLVSQLAKGGSIALPTAPTEPASGADTIAETAATAPESVTETTVAAAPAVSELTPNPATDEAASTLLDELLQPRES